MSGDYPVFTREAQCQDCYKCVRQCPVKAIRVKDARAAVLPEHCIACGHCVEVCPVHAKQIRNDLDALRRLLAAPTPVYVSLAPSWVSEFPELDASAMIATLRQCGFAGVSETALGAQAVSAAVAAGFAAGDYRDFVISSACPAAVDFIRKQQPELAPRITKLLSPVLAHCRILRERYGAIHVVFLGPCAAKKNEADRNPELLNLALTFRELREFLTAEGRDWAASGDAGFEPETAAEGALYPIEGGMNQTIQLLGVPATVQFLAVTGVENIRRTFRGLTAASVTVPTFVEVLACEGGCVHGPGSAHPLPGLWERLRVLEQTQWPPAPPQRPVRDDLAGQFPGEPAAPGVENAELLEALRRIGKFTDEDELNCSGCGYDSCRSFAKALLSGNAEPSMCVSYLRKQAQKKANAILRCIPSGVVIVDRQLNVVECNRNFAAAFGEDTLIAFEACPGLAGADLRRIVPFAELFAESLQSGEELTRDFLRVGRRLYHITIFNIEPHEVAGAVIFDVTNTELRREKIAERAREVIHKNLETVQEIACRLGEHMADTELLLRSIADDYADDYPGGDHE